MNDMAMAEAPPAAGMRREPFTFTGTTREYFGIWIVNVLLTILTLGIYSAWAKVRRQRYFYGNTHLAGASFDYHARPVRILIGRIVVLAILAAYNITLQVVPLVGGLIGLAALFAIPWFISRGLRFSARVTSYRNVRFDFTGGYWGAFLAYVLGWALIYGTAGILAPLASQWMWSYTLGNVTYGGRPVACQPRLEVLFRQWWLPAGVFVGGAAVLGLIAVAVMVIYWQNFLEVLGGPADSAPAMPYIIVAAIYFAFVPFLLLYMVAGQLYSAGTRNVAFNETIIDGRHALHSNVGRGRYAWIATSNLFATIFTLGLARPWAAIRMAHYLATTTALDASGPLDVYSGTVADSGAAVGAEFMDVEGIDFGF